jgi:hypothetical protein
MAGAKPPRRPLWLVRLGASYVAGRLRRRAAAGLNAKLKGQLCWSARHFTYREALRAAA